MRTELEIKSDIKDCISNFNSADIFSASKELFEKLGYDTKKSDRLDTNNPEDFLDQLDIPDLNKVRALFDQWIKIELVFQLTEEEVKRQQSLFSVDKIDRSQPISYLFIALELNDASYTRTQLSNITREINKWFRMPVMIVFNYGKLLTLSIINRRPNKRDENSDVLEKVTLIKDIVISNPHRAHIEILFDLTFNVLKSKHQFVNFIDLHNAWQKTLDTKELNKRFYSELFNWYLWAVKCVNFPNDVDDDKDTMVYNSESVIRLLTRLIFVWFIKEKNLVPETLFEIIKLKEILKDFNTKSEKTSIYYRAILQNLFFATLNTPMDSDITDENKDEKRRFINTLPKTGNDQYLDQTKYRYEDYFIKPDKALELFSSIPFLNGGLFECLDFKEGNKEIRFDGFSSTANRQAFVPDKLFFADEFILDLNSEYGTKGKKYKVEGLINILDSYKFTITENTPLEEEIALDPELLGKVFENLLASYNPETQTTARKQTGSFYTPREIVNYMVDESLIAYLNQKIDDTEGMETRLRELFEHKTDLPEFTESEKDMIIEAISMAKILDPACGSGAFPMGVLHRLVDLLNKLDADNTKWKLLQKQRAINETAEVFESGDTEERSIRLDEINKAFDLNINYPDYARKLFLIENCIYGVDIQQIAIQISKLRFFISLIVDQKVDDNKPNRNILSMPNLETKFVAANTLIGLDKPEQLSIISSKVEKLESELASIRHKIFFTRKYYAKKELKNKEKTKREELKKALIESGFGETTASQIAGWNPFDPMQSAKFFDPETMFGFNNGFDIVIGNPPYGILNKKQNKSESIVVTDEELEYFKTSQYYKPAIGGMLNIFRLFIFKSIHLLKQGGIFSEIFPLAFTGDLSIKNLRKYILENCQIQFIEAFPERDDANKRVFEAVKMSVCILNLKFLKSPAPFYLRINNDRFINQLAKKNYLSVDSIKVLDPINWTFPLTSPNETKLLLKIFQSSDRFSKIGKCNTGEIDMTFCKDAFSNNNKDAILLKGAIIDRYLLRTKMSQGEIVFIDEKILAKIKNVNPSIKESERIVLQGITGVNESTRLKMMIVKNAYCANSLNYLSTFRNINNKYLLSIFNSKLINFVFSKFSTNSNVNGYEVDNLPIKSKDTFSESLSNVVNMVLILKKQSKDSSFFERLIDALVYELYLPEEIKTGGADVLKYLPVLPELPKDDEKNLRTIEKVYKELSDPKHPVSIAMFKMDTIEEIRIIEGKQ
jgi:adenine-specific DNA-methyltransferase